MPGGLMQLVAYGAMDLYLTGNPQITFFKIVYRRHTHFATEYIEQPFQRLPNFSTTQMFARGYGNMYNSTNRTYVTATSEGFFDVKNSNHKVKFQYSTGNNVTISAQPYNLTYVVFMRLGDT